MKFVMGGGGGRAGVEQHAEQMDFDFQSSTI